MTTIGFWCAPRLFQQRGSLTVAGVSPTRGGKTGRNHKLNARCTTVKIGHVVGAENIVDMAAHSESGDPRLCGPQLRARCDSEGVEVVCTQIYS